ncbi:hypothetical protein SAMN05421748_126145 [Paractinoplanes atraurantiacus]|uniref:Uncharacterized protein n=1 Tax=Paractinoplanes atraurantiacus TaxID=1036182 RepID=A0A285JXG5_9ACTN|nr:hypothetical protein SAMN05421748_126145 [Actinoplanes atraurantiacus]
MDLDAQKHSDLAAQARLFAEEAQARINTLRPGTAGEAQPRKVSPGSTP